MKKEEYLYYNENDYELYKGKMQDVLSTFEANSVDSIVCDPPYELNFMGKGWDNSGVAFQLETWKHCFDVLKEGGYLLAFGGTRTFHRIACAIEDAGFEIRDTIMWLYGSGFPKSMNIGLAIDKKNGVESIDTGISSPNARPNSTKNNTLYKSGTVGKDFTIKKATNKWQGWGTCLKPAYEPVIVARKPYKGFLVDNVIKNGVGGINIDECRVDLIEETIAKNVGYKEEKQSEGWGIKKCITEQSNQGRFPANVILTYDKNDFDEVCGGMPNDDSVSASRYFYCAKASKKDRDEGLDLFEDKQTIDGCIKTNSENSALRKNIHPTVKPVELMQYLVRLVTPKGGTIMDCFMGSGSTGKAVMFENRERNANYKFIGVEMTEVYLPICQSRIDYAKNKYEYDLEKEIEELKKEKEEQGYISLFDL